MRDEGIRADSSFPQALGDAKVVAAPRRDTLLARLLTAAAGVPLIILAVIAGGPLYTAVVAGALVAGFREFARAARLEHSRLGMVALLIVAALPLAAHGSSAWTTGVLAAGVAASLVALVSRGEAPADPTAWALALAGVLYVGLLGAHFVALRLLPDGRDWVLLAIFTTFAVDTGAYAAGRLLGRHKLAPRLSPAKTVEGALGGLVAGAVAALALSAALGLDRNPAAILTLGAAAAVAAQLGDLAESLIKRACGVKDMGGIFPGHGGILDRLDSLLFVVPLVYYVAQAWLV